MRILMVQASSAGGVGRHVADAASGVSARGHHVLVAGPETVREQLERATSAQVGAHATRDGVPGHVVVEISESPRPAQDARCVAALARLAGGADVVHAHGLRAGALAALALSPKALPGNRTPLVVTLHNLPLGDRAVELTGEALLTLVARRARVVLGVSRDIMARVRARGRAVVGRALVPAPLGPPVDIDDVTRARHVLVGPDGPDTVVVLTVGRLAPQKGLDVLVAAGHDIDVLLSATGRSVRFVVAGEGPLRDHLANQARVAHVPLHLLGARDDVAALLRAADVVVVPSRWEGQPLIVQEALRAGCAIVATDAGGTAEVTDDAAVLVPPEDPDALARAVVDLLTTPGRLDEMRTRALQRARELPTNEDMVTQLVTRYSALVSGAPSRR